MKKSYKKINKIIVLFLTIILCTQNFAAVVADADMSAFMTKAEFDTIKNNFQSSLDKYNANIDNKIDDAIASYLAGIKVDKTPENYILSFEQKTGTKQTWIYSMPGIGEESCTKDVMLTYDVELAIKRVNNLSMKMGKWEGAQDQYSYFVSCVAFPQTTWSDRYAFQNYYAEYRTNGSLYAGFQYFPTGDIVSETGYRNLTYATYGVFPQNTVKIEQKSTGQGSGWLWQDFGNGRLNLKYYCTQIYPKFDILWKLHYYKYFPASSFDYYLKSAGLTITDLSIPENVVLESEWGATAEIGTEAPSSTDTNLYNYASLSSSLVKTSDGNNYLNVVWGGDNQVVLYGNDEDEVPNLDSNSVEIQTTEDIKYQNQCFQLDGLKNFETSYPTVKQKFKLRTYELKEKQLKDFCNNTLSNIASEDVYNGNGAPCYNCADDDIECKGEIKLLTTSGTCTCNVKISDKPFNNGEIATGANKIADVSINTGHTETIKLNNKSKGNYYIFIKNETNSNPITIDSFKIEWIR